MSLESRIDRLETSRVQAQEDDYAVMLLDPRYPLELARRIAFALAVWKHQRPAPGTEAFAACQRLATWWDGGADWYQVGGA